MIKYKIIIVIMLLSVGLTACSVPKEADIKVTDLSDLISEKIAKDYNTSSEQLGYNRLDMKQEEGKDIVVAMKLKNDGLEEGIYLSDPTRKTSNRIIIAKAKKDTDIKDLVTAFKKMKDAQEKEWKEKQPEQYKKVKDAVVDTNGKYVTYIVYDDMASLLKIINDKIAESKESK